MYTLSAKLTFQSRPDTEAYSVAKGGIVALTHTMAVSLAGKARVNVISPGWIDTSENPLHSAQDKQQHPGCMGEQRGVFSARPAPQGASERRRKKKRPLCLL